MSSPFRSSRGFSLIELMFSMAIGSIVLLLAASMLGASGDSYERVGGSVASEREARALMSQLATDLATGLYHKEGVIEKSAQSWPADRIGFLSLQPTEAQTRDGHVGDLCAVNYYIKDLSVGGKTTRCLMRGFRESKPTFEALRKDAVAPLFTEQPTIDEPVAFGVVSFEGRPKSRDPAGQWIDWVKNDLTGPEALEVKLVVARRNLVAKLRKPGDWDGAGNALGDPSQAGRNQNLEIYGAILRFGNHAQP